MSDEVIKKETEGDESTEVESAIDALAPRSPEQIAEQISRLQTQLLKDIDLPAFLQAKPTDQEDESAQRIVTEAINKYLKTHGNPEYNQLVDALESDTVLDVWSRKWPQNKWNADLKVSLAEYALSNASDFGGLEAIKVGIGGLIFGHQDDLQRHDPVSSKSGQFIQQAPDVLWDNPLYRLYESLPKSNYTGAVRT